MIDYNAIASYKDKKIELIICRKFAEKAAINHKKSQIKNY
jgi:hypothetical protein